MIEKDDALADMDRQSWQGIRHGSHPIGQPLLITNAYSISATCSKFADETKVMRGLIGAFVILMSCAECINDASSE